MRRHCPSVKDRIPPIWLDGCSVSKSTVGGATMEEWLGFYPD